MHIPLILGRIAVTRTNGNTHMAATTGSYGSYYWHYWRNYETRDYRYGLPANETLRLPASTLIPANA